MGLFGRKPPPKPVREMHASMDEWNRAETEWQKAVKTGNRRKVDQASVRLTGAQWGHRVASSRNGDRFWE